MNIRPDAAGFVADRLGSRATQFFELLFANGRILREKKRADQGMRPERITRGGLDGSRDRLVKIDRVLEMFGARLSDVRYDRLLRNDGRSRR